jgi:hypothetical protein
MGLHVLEYSKAQYGRTGHVRKFSTGVC